MGWTQPICSACWIKDNPAREPSVLAATVLETCCLCGEHTRSGIYIRIDPKKVKYSIPDKEDLK